MWLTRLALRNPIFILMMSLMTLVLGGVSVHRLSVDLFPDITIPVVRVATFYTGAGPQDIEKSITLPLERAIASTPGIDRVESISRQGVSVVTAWFDYGTNLDNAQFEVSQRVSQILFSLPPGIQQPFVQKFDITNMPVAGVAVTSPDLEELQLYDLAYNVIAPQLERVTGVASASVGGGKVREIEVMARRDALRARDLSIMDVVNAVRTSNLRLPSGHLRADDLDYNVFANTEVNSAAPLRDVVVRRGSTDPSGVVTPPVRISDVATVMDMTADQQQIVRVNGARGVFIRLLKQPGANTIAVVDDLRETLGKLRGVPDNVQAAIAFDQSLYIRAAMSSLQHEATWGGLLAVATILIFLASLRATGIVAVAIPLSIVATFVLLFFTGQTLNVFTLGGLALGVGRLVDDSIVELENIHRHFGLGQSRVQAVLAAAQEVAMPILVSTVTTIIVFFPVLFLTGVAKSLFLPLAMTIAFSLIMSFLVSRTVTPLLCLYGLRHHQAGQRGRLAAVVERAQARLDGGYARALGWVLRHRAFTVAVILGIFVASLGLARFVGTEFFPQTDESQFTATYRAPVGTRLERAEQVSRRVEAVSRRVLAKARGKGGGEIFDTIISETGVPAGRGAVYRPNAGPHWGTLQVRLVPPTEREVSDVEAVARLRRALGDKFPGVKVVFFVGGIVKRILSFGSSAPIEVEILGHDLEQGADYARRLMLKLQDLRDRDGQPFITDVDLSREEDYPELNVVVDRQKAGVLGVTTQDVAQTVLASLVGTTQFQPVPFSDPKTGNEYYINVRLEDAYRERVSDLGDILLRTQSGKVITLDTVATVKRGSGPVQINRKHMQRIVSVTANVGPGKSLGAVSAAVQRAIDESPPPAGFNVQLAGETAAQEEAFGALKLAALMAVLLVYMVLASQFKSLLHPLVIMFAVPLGVTGVILMLLATGTTLSVNSVMGIIMMVGIVVSNGVLLVDFTNTLRRRGLPVTEALVQAGRTRLRPILMTTVATLVGLAPMALGVGEGSETNMPLARAVIGGLAVSTVFTLFLVPALYSALDRFSRRPRGAEQDGGPLGGDGDRVSP